MAGPTSTAPSGSPPPSGLARAMMSGTMPLCWNAKSVPVRPRPHWISSKIKIAPARAASLRRGARHACVSGVVIEVGDVEQRVRLIPQHFLQPRMAMSKSVDGDPAEQVPVLPAVGVVDPRPFPAAGMERSARVRTEDERLLAALDGFRGF